jgi:hypothetical protein
LRWRAGRNSYVRDCWSRSGSQAGPAFRDYPHVLITGSGGGRWYNSEPTNEASTSDQTLEFRSIKVDGTSEPLHFYQMNASERCNGQSGIEIANASNVTIYSIKHEDGHKNAPEALRVTNSRNIRVFGHAGNGGNDMVAGDDMYHIENCESILLANLAIMAAFTAIPTRPWDMIDETFGAARVHLSGDKSPIYYKRGTISGCAPQFSANPLSRPPATPGIAYTASSLAVEASDEDGSSAQLTFSLVSPASSWLTVAPNGTLSGNPSAFNGGLNVFRVRVTDAAGMYSDAELRIVVAADSAASNWQDFK